MGQQVLAEHLHLFVVRSFRIFEFAVVVFTYEVLERGASCLSL